MKANHPSGTRTPDRLLHHLGVAVGVLLLVPAVSGATTSYRVVYGHPRVGEYTTTPQRVSLVLSDSYGSYAEDAYAIPGRVMARSHTNSVFGGDNVSAFASTDDFIVTGPSGSDTVSATIFFVVHLDLKHSGIATDNSTSASGLFQFDENYAEAFSIVMGDATSGNGSSYGHDALASYAGGAVDEPVSFTATLPVGAPFGINIGVGGASEAYSAGITDGYVAGEIGDASGHVMDLPAGYTVNSLSWGVVDNVSTGAVAAAPEAAHRNLVLAPLAPNPSVGNATLSYVLPHEGEVSLEILDLQGRIVRMLARGTEQAGVHKLMWDGRDASGHRVSEGVYFARLGFEGQRVTRRLTRLE